MNDGDNVDDQEDYVFTGQFFKIVSTVIDDYTICFLNIQLENLRPQRNIKNNKKQSDERYQINMIYDKESDEGDHIFENKEETLNPYTELLKLQILSSQKT